MKNQDGDKYRILVVEDAVVGQVVVRNILEAARFNVSIVSDGLAAIEALAGMQYDLVVMDCMMPDMDGFEATRRIRAGDAGADNETIPIIALTALVSVDDQDRCREAGMNDFVRKPVDEDDLVAAVLRQLEKKPAGPVVATADGSSEAEQKSLMAALEEWSPGFMDSIIDQFLADVPGEIEALRTALEASNLARLRDIAHRLRGAADVLQAHTLSSRALALEKASAEGRLPLARQLTPALMHELGKLDETLRDPD